MWVKCSNCRFGGNGDNTCEYGKDVKRCANDVGCVSTGIQINEVYDNGHGVYFCPNCNGSVWQNKDESNYCFRCGHKLEWRYVDE